MLSIWLNIHGHEGVKDLFYLSPHVYYLVQLYLLAILVDINFILLPVFVVTIMNMETVSC